jgi:hypothetical protein
MVERLGPKVALGTDGTQWIIYKRGAGSIAWQGETWSAVGFIHSSKAALRDCLRVKGLELDAAGEAALARQPRRIYRWVKG